MVSFPIQKKHSAAPIPFFPVFALFWRDRSHLSGFAGVSPCRTAVGWVLVGAVLAVGVAVARPALRDAVAVEALEAGGLAGVGHCWKQSREQC